MARTLGALTQRTDRAAVRLDRWPVTVELRMRDQHVLERRLIDAQRTALEGGRARFDVLRRRLERRDVRRLVADGRARTTAAEHRLRTLVTSRRHAAERRAAALAARLDALSPLAVLGRGYAVCWNESRTGIIRSSAQVQPGERVQVTLADGEIGCRVEERKLPQ